MDLEEADDLQEEIRMTRVVTRRLLKMAEAPDLEIGLEVWESMNHVFQAYGDQLPEAGEAMRWIATIVHQE